MEKKPYKTLKFWATAILTLLGLTLASGVVDPTESKVDEAIGWVTAMAALLGFSGWKPGTDEPEDTAGN